VQSVLHSSAILAWGLYDNYVTAKIFRKVTKEDWRDKNTRIRNFNWKLLKRDKANDRIIIRCFADSI